METVGTLFLSIDWFVVTLVFASYILVDGLYAKYTLEVVSLKPYQSATIGSLMHFLLAFGVINYTENWLYIFPVVAGSWIGTYLMVRFEKSKKGSK